DGAGRCDLADAVVVRVRHVHVAAAVDGDAERAVEAGLVAIAVGVTALAGAGQGGDTARGRHFANAVVFGIGHVDVAVLVHRHAGQPAELGVERLAVGKAVLPGAGQRAHLTLRADLAQQEVAVVGHVDVAVLVHRYPVRLGETGRARRAVVGAGIACAGERGGSAVTADSADALVDDIRHVQRALAIDGDGVRLIEAGRAGLTLGEAGLPRRARERRHRRPIVFEQQQV